METKDTMSQTAGTAGPGSTPASGAGAGGHAGKVAADTRAAVDREMQDARDRAAATAGEVKREAMGAGDRIAGLASEQAERGKDAASQTLRTFADAVRSASDELGAQDQSMSARIVRQAAEGLESLSGNLDSRSAAGMTRSVTDFGRQNPGMFLAGCLLAGLAAGRFLTASSDGRDDYDDDFDDYAPARPQAGYGYGGPQVPQPGAGDFGAATGSAPGLGGTAGYGAGASGRGAASDFGGGATRQAGRFEGLSEASGAENDPLGTRVDPDAPRAGSASGAASDPLTRREGGSDGGL